VRLTLTRDAGEFVTRAEGFLAARMEHNILATVSGNAAARGYEGLFAYGLDDRDEVVYAAVRTPPWPLLTGELYSLQDADSLVAEWLAHDAHVPGVSGPPATARAISRAWTKVTGHVTRLSRSEAIHALTEVRDPSRPAAGTLRATTADERALVIGWLRGFNDEVRDGIGDPERMVDERGPQSRLFVWDDRGPVCLVGCSPVVNRVARVAPVYTPPELRRRGYAGTAVAALSRRLLERDADRCMLYTDLANPTSNKIYAEVGYVRFADWEEHDFG
jgi:predicted GNAT family acetyltransferase